MAHSGARSESVWLENPIELGTSLQASDRVDVCVVGAGIAGLSTAYALARAGKSVAVLDDRLIGGQQTMRTTAHLVNVLDDRYYELERLHGANGARLAAESHTAALDQIEAIVRREKIDCEFTRLDGYLFVPRGKPCDVLERELAAVQRAGIVGVQYLDRLPYDAFDFGPCLRFPNQAQFHPARYLRGLAEAILREGGKLYSRTHAERIDGGDVARVKVKGGATITADAVVVATNTPINDLVYIHTKQAGYLTYVIGARIPRGSIPTMLLWDTEQERNPEAYHYVRLTHDPHHSENDILIIGGEDHRTGQANDAEVRYARLESWARERFPMIDSIAYRWAGQVMEPVDGMAFIGRNPGDADNVFIATGDSGNGMTHGVIAGMLLSDLILHRPNRWEKLYDPSRKTLGAFTDYTKENLNTAFQYADWLRSGDVDSASQIPNNSGAVIRSGLTKIAVYRDEQGTLHECSAVCPHLNCVVHWNGDDRTWDCPCHGSRFDCYGKVINGPASSDLAVHEHVEAKS